MKIIGLDSQIVEIHITNYQFPITTKYIEDRNWLNVLLNVESKQGKWKTISAALTTSDIIEIKNWFIEILEKHKPNDKQLEFLEPNLSFEFRENHNLERIIRVNFDLEFRPPEFDDDNEYFVDFQATTSQLKNLIQEINLEILNYPKRK